MTKLTWLIVFEKTTVRNKVEQQNYVAGVQEKLEHNIPTR